MLNPRLECDRRRAAPWSPRRCCSHWTLFARRRISPGSNHTPPLGGVVLRFEWRRPALGRVDPHRCGANTWQAITDASGRFEFPQLAPGRYEIDVKLMGFRPLHHVFELRSPQDWESAITLDVGQCQKPST